MYSINPRPQPPSPLEIQISDHCLDQFGNRVYPCFDLPRLETELERLLDAHAELVYVRPGWIKAPPNDPAVAWAVVQSDIALPLVPHSREHGVLVATTCLTAGGISHAERDRRKIRKAKQRKPRRR